MSPARPFADAVVPTILPMGNRGSKEDSPVTSTDFSELILILPAVAELKERVKTVDLKSTSNFLMKSLYQLLSL